MKILTFLLVIALSFAQNPIPIPKLNLQDVGGYWYIPWILGAGNNPNNESSSCYGACILTTLDSGIFELYFETSDSFNEGILEIESISTTNSSWKADRNLTITWLAIDPISTSWGLLYLGVVGQHGMSVLLLSRTPNISTVVVKGISLLLNQEGIPVNSQDSNYFQNCPPLMTTPTPYQVG